MRHRPPPRALYLRSPAVVTDLRSVGIAHEGAERCRMALSFGIMPDWLWTILGFASVGVLTYIGHLIDGWNARR